MPTGNQKERKKKNNKPIMVVHLICTLSRIGNIKVNGPNWRVEFLWSERWESKSVLLSVLDT